MPFVESSSPRPLDSEPVQVSVVLPAAAAASVATVRQTLASYLFEAQVTVA